MMENQIKVETKTNGYTAETIQRMIEIFEKVSTRLFPGCLVRHFYYGDYLDMADIILESGHYAHFNIAEKRVSLCGYSCSDEELKKFQRMTYKDECYKGRLLELAK